MLVKLKQTEKKHILDNGSQTVGEHGVVLSLPCLVDSL